MSSVADHSPLEAALAIRQRIAKSETSVYTTSPAVESDLFYPPAHIQVLLREALVGSTALAGLPVRTRSKVAKGLVCDALGYPVPSSFRKTQPRLPHPNLDTYVQKANNLQIWNEDVDGSRRYAVVTLNQEEVITNVFVIAGADLAQFDSTGTLTSKYQASRIDESAGSVLVSPNDTSRFIETFNPVSVPFGGTGPSPVALPTSGRVLTVQAIYDNLRPLVGGSYVDPGMTQERNRGTVVHRRACEALGLAGFADNGQFPDVLSQALEVKLQLARTIDLGLELPDSDKPLASLNGRISARDVRYAVFYGVRSDSEFVLTSLVVTTGVDFFKEFRQFGGKVSNSKLQLRLPSSWF